MRLSVHIALLATAVSAGCCASNRCGDCCGAPACGAPGHCVVNPGGEFPPQPVPEVAPEPPMEPGEEAPEPPPATARRMVPKAIDNGEMMEEGEPATEPVSTIAPEGNSDYGFDPQYSWLMGRLQRVHVPGGEWKLRYAPLDKQDRWGGSVVLATDVRLDAYVDGDIVYVEGEILAARPTLYLSGPLYRVRTIRPATARDRERVAREIR